MKKISLSTLFSLVTIFALFTAAFAEATALPGSGWWSGEQVQNVGSSSADIYIDAYDKNSSNTYQASINKAPGESHTFLPWDFPTMPPGFEGSAVVSSAADIRAIVNVTVKYNGARGVGDPSSPSPATGQYQGVVVPDDTIYFPLVKSDHGDKTTNFAIQNAGTAATTVHAVFTLPNAPGGPMTAYPYDSPSIEPNKMIIISPSDAPGAPSGDGIVGSLVVTSNAVPKQPLAGTSMEFVVNETHPTVLQTMRAFVDRPDVSVTDFDDKYYAPIIKKGWSGTTSSRNTGIQVQNVNGSPVNITVTYVGNPGAPACANQTYTATFNNLPNGESHTFLSRDDIPVSPCLAAATITATGNILAIVNESYSPIPAGTYQEATSYNAFPDNQKTTFVSVPLFKENSFGKKTGISVMNVGAAAANNVVAKFIGPAGTFTTTPQHIDLGGNMILLDVRNQPGSFWSGTAMTPLALGCAVPDNSTGCGANGVMGVIITSDQPIVAIANETAVARFFLQDKNNYEGFNLDFDPTAP